MASFLETVTRERAAYGERLTPAQAHELLNRVALQHEGVGLLAKTSGNRWNGCALDILVLKADGHHYDCLIDAPDTNEQPHYNGTCKPNWLDQGPIDMSRYVAPVGTAPAPPQPVPQPQPQPNPPAAEPPACQAKYAALTDVVNEMAKAVAKANSDLAAVARRVEMLAADVALLKSEPVSFEVQTSREWGHSHKVIVKG